MAIPTQFSVTNKRSAPIANPAQPIDGANPLTAESIGFISGAATLPALSGGSIAAPSELTAQSIGDVDSASLFGALSVGTINNPSIVTAESVAPVDNATLVTAKNAPSIATPSTATAENQPSIATPSALTARPSTLTIPPFPLNHARILYENRLESLDASSSSIPGSSPINAIKPNTWERFNNISGGNGYVRFDMSATRGVDTICIGAHNAGSKGYNFIAYYRETVSGPLIQFSTGVTPDTDAPIMFHINTLVSAKVIEIYFNGGLDLFSIGYISAGVALQMQRPFFNGHQPYTDSDVTEYYSNRTESGEIIGRQIRRKGYETTFEWQNLDDEWYRANIPAFKESVKTRPMFIAWNLLEYPRDVAFGETTGDISTSMQNGTRTKRTGLSFTLKGV